MRYLSKVRRLDGKPRADYGAGEEGKEGQEKERDKHGVLFYYTRTEGGTEGREGTTACHEAKHK